jgi:hypothetical protein
VSRQAAPSAWFGQGGKAVHDPAAGPLELADVTRRNVARHLREFHSFPAEVLDAGSVDELLVWHAGEHSTRDAPKTPSRKNPVHAGHLRHRHDPAAAGSVVLERPIPRGRVA